MHRSLLSISMAIALHTTSSFGVPTGTTGTGKISSIVGHIGSNGQVGWTPTDSTGGRSAVIPGDLISSAEQYLAVSRKLSNRDTSAHVGGFTNLGQIANIAASYACETSGAYGVSASLGTLATDACSTFLQSVPGAPVAEKAWIVWQSPTQPGLGGGQINTIFRYFYHSAAAPKLTDTLCKKAYEDLTTIACQGKGDKGTGTRGGEVKIGSGEDYLMIGFDPNEA